MESAVPAKRRLRSISVTEMRRPFQRFFRAEASSGILLMFCIVLALVWANSPWADSYTDLWQTTLSLSLGSFSLSKSLHLWINDGLMVVFFFVVGLEIKRELLVGELSTPQRAALPLAAALGGMVAPAAIYLLLNAGGAGMRGWGIPMATDIAFALGILSLLGRRAPLTLKVFLTALAIVDDIGAVVIIALFYTAEISWLSLAVGGGFLLVLLAANRAGVRQPLLYALLGVGLWLAFLKSGVHATIAGVLLAMTIPPRTAIDAEEFLAKGTAYLQNFERSTKPGKSILSNSEQRAAVQALEIACQEVESPLQRLEHALHPWVAYAIMPLFALANAGVSLAGNTVASITDPVALGIVGGLVIGKQLGVMAAAWLVIRTNLAAWPGRVTWRQLYGAAWLAGIGFTMSLFISSLAFGTGPFQDTAKVGVLAASILAGLGGWLILRKSEPSGSRDR